ncbi:hypothetical protein [Streptomyces sp. NBC_01264]|uniref:hypothetical protein n=1 Tax=Streptomyces sp. NBC_01264 TaxID=2903804 RepID=UPI00225B1022|nr:hypothetical protein [Streptomyces sp. NBC_01264]MCX4779362.1 hypothetical protein [Streptomyces sp. NBC_01264]
MTEQNTTGAVTVAPGDEPVAAAAAPETSAAPESAAPESAAPEVTATPEVTADPEAPGAAESAAPEVPAAPKDRRKLFAALRWTAAVLVFGAVGTGVAYQVTQAERTDIPGLSTKADGRWVYPALVKPTLPAGAALPFAKDNEDGIHYAGLTQLLLPPPTGSTPDSTLKLEKDEVVTPDSFLTEYDASEHAEMKAQFANDGLRQIVGRGWTTPDGTLTRVYLLRYHSSGFADSFEECGDGMHLNATNVAPDQSWAEARNRRQSWPGLGAEVMLYAEPAPFGDVQAKVGCVRSGDVVAVILQSRKGGVAAVPFHQTVILQHQLLD